MKKLYCMLCLVLSIWFLSACSSENPVNTISKQIGIDLSGGTILYNEDTHGGFHGDGYTFVKLNFDDTTSTIAEDIAKHGSWQELPLSENLHRAVYGKKDRDSSYNSLVLTDEITIPAIENGYYFFYDRHSESNDHKNDTDLFSRYSYNFTIALYDTEHHDLYYYKFDT